MIKYLKTFFFVIFTCTSLFYSQIRIKEIPSAVLSEVDSVFFNITSKRNIIPLNKNWKAYSIETDDESIEINLPSIFENTESIVLEHKFELNNDIINNYKIFLKLLGINYSAEIYINDVSVFKNTVANIPLQIELNKELLNSGQENVISIKVIHILDSETSIPTHQRFLFPKNYGGVTRDVYLELVPVIHFSNLVSHYENNSPGGIGNIKVKFNIDFGKQIDSTVIGKNLEAELNVIDESIKRIIFVKKINVIPGETSKEYEIVIPANLISRWSPRNPNFYTFRLSLTDGSRLIDLTTIPFSIFDIKHDRDSFLLNNSNFQIKGVTYIKDSDKIFNTTTYNYLLSDLKAIKDLGFNTVRFAKEIPHPYALRLCEKIGLLAVVEIPINSIPGSIAGKNNYQYRAVNIFNKFLENYSNKGSILAIGVGGGYDSDLITHREFISMLAGRVKTKTSQLSFASFTDVPSHEIEYLDIYGVELFTNLPSEQQDNFEHSVSIIGAKRLLISEATFPNYIKDVNGYLTDNSEYAQAKFFEDMFAYTNNSNLLGFVFNTMFSYNGNFASLYANSTVNNQYNFEIFNSDNKPVRIVYNVIKSKLSNGERVTIPIGSKHDDSPLFIIFVGLSLAVLMGILINSKKKFREDATRALLRPYNFYADIRDHRILSGLHTIALMIILAGSHSLLLVNLVYYLKNSLLFEKIILAFGSPSLMNLMVYLSWNPFAAFIYLYIFSILLYLFIALVIKGGSLFIKTKVMFSSIFYSLVWATLPLAVLLPVKLVLYRILIADIGNLYIAVFLVLYFFWILQRILKGVYVIFDVNKLRVYFYSYLLLLIMFGSVLLYFQIKFSSIYYIIYALTQFKII